MAATYAATWAPDARVAAFRRLVLRNRRALVVARDTLVGVWSDGFTHAGNLAYLSLLTLFPFFIVLATVAGGEVRDLAITLIIGVITGTFSSLFIASPIFFWWHKGDRRHVEKSHDVKPTYEWDATSKASK